jgi:hypothetical protein
VRFWGTVKTRVAFIALLIALTVGGAAALSALAQDTAPPSTGLVPKFVYQGTTESKYDDTSGDRLGCSGLSQPLAFTPYSLGPTFGEFPSTFVLRRCDAPYPGETVRANYVSYVYGDCVPGEADACAPPVEIQTWPACERSLADYSFDGQAYPAEDVGAVRGVPSARFEDDDRLELYTGGSTVVIFGDSPETLSTAADAVRPEPATQVDAPVSGAERAGLGLPTSDEPLPDPAKGAIAGELTCNS